MEQYTYSPLPTPTSIRLLRIGKKDESGRFQCSLKTVDLEDNPWYYAFSYTWGNPHAIAQEDHAFTNNYEALQSEYAPGARHPILCDGELLYINKNLYDAFGDIPKDAWTKFINRKNKRGWTRLHIYVLSQVPGSDEGVRQVLRSGIDLDAQDNIGATALNWAARIGNFDMIKLLVEAGAQIDIPNSDSKTALDYAHDLQEEATAEYLEKASREFKAPSRLETTGEGPEVWAWIDQVCINQNDPEERGSQVGMMDQIYQKSTFTIIWLGREDSYTKIAVSVIDKIVPAMERFVNSDIVPYSSGSEDAYTKAGIPYISEEEWESLAALFQRQYFRRLWIVQEIIISELTLSYCGDVEIIWRDLCTAAQLLVLRQDKIGVPVSSIYVPRHEAARSIESSVVQLVDWKSRWVDGNEATKPRELSEENLIFDTCHFHATDPRDKIYGLYGLLKLKASESIDWEPDYEKSVDQVYAEATKRIINHAGELRILSSVLDHSLRKIITLPSWIPDFSVTFQNMMCAIYNAAGKLPIPSPLIPPSQPWNELRVYGTQIGTVLRTGSTTSGPDDPHKFFDPSWLELTLLVPATYPHTNQPRTEVLWRCLCANRDSTGSTPAPSHYRNGFCNMLARMLVRTAWMEEGLARQYPESNYSPSLSAAVATNNDIWNNPPFSDLPLEDLECEYSFPDHNFFSANHQRLVYTLLKVHVLFLTEGHSACVPTLEHLLEAEKELETKSEDPIVLLRSAMRKPSDFVTAIRGRVGRRRLFVTEDRLMGLGPAGMKQSDGLWVLPGAGAVFVLRKCNGNGASGSEHDMRYTFIGEAYLHGAMDGEAVDCKDIELKEVVLV